MKAKREKERKRKREREREIEKERERIQLLHYQSYTCYEAVDACGVIGFTFKARR